jgi:hypothetical protein
LSEGDFQRLAYQEGAADCPASNQMATRAPLTLSGSQSSARHEQKVIVDLGRERAHPFWQALQVAGTHA